MKFFILTGLIFSATATLLAITLVMNRIYLNQAADQYSDKEMLQLIPSTIAFALFTALTIRTVKER